MAGQVVQEQLAGLEPAVPRAAVLKGAAAVAVLEVAVLEVAVLEVAVLEVAVREVAVREVAVPAARQVGLAVTVPRGPNVRAAPSES